MTTRPPLGAPAIVLAAALVCGLLPARALAQSAQLISPSNVTLGSTSAWFTWSAGTNATQYWLYAGRVPFFNATPPTQLPLGLGSTTHYYSNQGTSQSVIVNGLPNDGSTIYIRLWSLIDGNWVFNDYTAFASDGRPYLTAPAYQATLTSSSPTFSWTQGNNIAQYWLWVGTTAGGNDIFDQDQGVNQAATVSGLPVNGSAVYVRLWGLQSGNWVFRDHTFTAASGSAQLTTPAPGSALTGTSATFEWTGGINVAQYWLAVGTSPGGTQLYYQDQGTNLTTLVTGLPANGSTLHARLWSLISGDWTFHDYTFSAINGNAQLTAPAPSSTLAGSSESFAWTAGIGVTQYWLYVGTTPGGSQILNQDQNTALTASVSGLPTTGSTLYIRLWSLMSGAWGFSDYTVTASNGRAQLTAPAPGSTLGSTTVNFSWTTGTNVTQYWLSVGTSAGAANLYNQDRGSATSTSVSGLPGDGSPIYVRLYSLVGGNWGFNDYTYTAANGRAQLTTPAPGSTLSDTSVTFEWTAGTNVSQYWLYIGTTGVGSFNLRNQDQATNLAATIVGLPANASTVDVRLWSLLNGNWLFNDYTLTAATSQLAQLTSPTPGSVLTATSVNFQWSGGIGMTQYWLQVYAHDGFIPISGQFDSSMQTTLSRVVTGLPTDGRQVTVRLYSRQNATQDWLQWNTYTFTATTATAERAELTSPAPNSTLGATTVNVQWTGGTNLTQYWLQVGSTLGAGDLHNQTAGTNLSATVTGLPSDGRTLYVRVWGYRLGIYWEYTDYVLTASF